MSPRLIIKTSHAIAIDSQTLFSHFVKTERHLLLMSGLTTAIDHTFSDFVSYGG